MYRGKNLAKHSLIVHLVFVVKYRNPLLIKLGEDAKRLVFEACTKYEYELIVCEVDIDHIHILLEYKPKSNVSSMIKNLKQYTTYHLRQEYDDFISKFIYESRRFWSRGYFACSIGKGASYKSIKKYIKNQG